MTVPAALDQIRDLHSGASYPGHVLHGCDTALVLFCAAFAGKQDAYWIADAGLTATCVDQDEQKLLTMAKMYPQDWWFIVADAYKFGEQADETWDIVSLDPWTQDFQKTADYLQLWCDLANKAVIFGTGVTTTFDVPDGWKLTDVRKRSDHSGGVFWSVVEPA